MKKSRFVLIILAVVIMIVACFSVYNTNFKPQTDAAISSPAITNEKVSYEPVMVRYVVDGDTLAVTDEDGNEFKVRLIGCNTPESVSSDENKNTPIKKSLYYTEKNFNFVRVFFKILYTLFTFNFTIAKKYPSIIRRKIQVLLMCFERKFTNYFIKTKILTVFIDEDSLPVPLFVQLTKKFVLVVEI